MTSSQGLEMRIAGLAFGHYRIVGPRGKRTLDVPDGTGSMRDAPLIRIVTALLVGTVCAVGCSRGNRDVRPDAGNEQVRRTIRRCSPQVRACYNTELIDNPGLEGRIDVRCTVGREGRVTTAAVGASTLRNPTLETCLVDVVKLCPFAKPVDGRPVDLSYTFDFGPSKPNDGT